MRRNLSRLGRPRPSPQPRSLWAERLAQADDWKPTRPIEIVVPSGPGGGLDLVGRTLQSVMEQEKLSERR